MGDTDINPPARDEHWDGKQYEDVINHIQHLKSLTLDPTVTMLYEWEIRLCVYAWNAGLHVYLRHVRGGVEIVLQNGDHDVAVNHVNLMVDVQQKKLWLYDNARARTRNADGTRVVPGVEITTLDEGMRMISSKFTSQNWPPTMTTEILTNIHNRVLRLELHTKRHALT